MYYAIYIYIYIYIYIHGYTIHDMMCHVRCRSLATILSCMRRTCGIVYLLFSLSLSRSLAPCRHAHVRAAVTPASAPISPPCASPPLRASRPGRSRISYII